MTIATGLSPLNSANRLGLLYRHEAARLPWVPPPITATGGGIIDCHVHVHGTPDGPARVFFETAVLFGVRQVWSQTPLEEVDALREAYGDRIAFIAVPSYALGREGSERFADDWVQRVEAFAKKGARMVKFWNAPRGRDFGPWFRLDHPIRHRVMCVARDLGMMFMTHVADPDTWFATHYKDANKYGTKADQYEPLERLLDEFHDVTWLGAHMGGDPEHLDHLQDLLDRHPNYHIDTSATKWMVRELSKRPRELREFCQRNPGRILFGTDIVVNAKEDLTYAADLYASRYWALRTMLETDYQGPSPIVDPDLPLLDPSLPPTATPTLRGAALDPPTLEMIYTLAAERLGTYKK